MKGFYVLRPSETTHDHVRYAVNIGAIDTVMLAVESLGDTKPWLDSYDFSVETLNLYGDFGVNAYPVLEWQVRWLAPDHPVNNADNRIALASKIMEDTGVNGVIWDFEDYRFQDGNGRQQSITKDFDERCRIASVTNVGGMPLSTNGVWFTEKTYEKNEWWEVKWKGRKKKIVPGAWVEMHNDPAKYIRKLKKCYKGYWVYSHVLFGQRMIDPLDIYLSSEPLPLTWWEAL